MGHKEEFEARLQTLDRMRTYRIAVGDMIDMLMKHYEGVVVPATHVEEKTGKNGALTKKCLAEKEVASARRSGYLRALSQVVAQMQSVNEHQQELLRDYINWSRSENL